MIRNQSAREIWFVASAKGIIEVVLSYKLSDIGNVSIVDLNLVDRSRGARI
jgi:hypothetical protein